VRYVGTGETMEDLVPFDAETFVSSLFDERARVRALLGSTDFSLCGFGLGLRGRKAHRLKSVLLAAGSTFTLSVYPELFR